MTEPDAAAAFFDAIRKGNELAVDTAIALNGGALRFRDPEGRSAILAAVYAGKTRIAAGLAARMVAAPSGLDIFDAAAVGNTVAIRALLADERVSVDDRGRDGYAALHHAAALGQLEVARLLLGRGADPNAVSMNDKRTTPLHSAIAAGHRDTASLLLALGASPNSVQRGGYTALHLASRVGDEAVVDMLLIRGADPTRKADDGKTPVDLAEQGGYGALAKLLRTAARR
jgi:uncharacterized protein